MSKHLILYVLLALTICSCILQDEDDGLDILIFYTDSESVEDQSLFVDDEHIGQIDFIETIPDCNDDLLMTNVPENGEAFSLYLQDSIGAKVKVGELSIDSVATGLKVRSENGYHIYLHKMLDEPCISIRIR